MRECKRCLMDESTRLIDFDDDGNCNYCRDFKNLTYQNLVNDKDNFIEKVKLDGIGKKYDCIVGVSGGVDSSYVLHLAVQNGLRPLAVHMDNTCNAEIAVSNISNLVRALNVDLYTHVIKWEEYKDLLLSFMSADVVDLEMLYDNAMWGVNIKLAKRFKIKYILSGSNSATEGFKIPKDWNWYKLDKRNILDIYKSGGGTKKLNSFPFASSFDYASYKFFNRGSWVSFLDYFDYKKDDALDLLREKYSYKPYPFKHYESVLTRFYQGYILPVKFGIDKRRLHFSNLILTEQMTRSDAAYKLSQLPYESEFLLKQDKKFFIKKLGITESQLKNYLSRPVKNHSLYKNESSVIKILKKLF